MPNILLTVLTLVFAIQGYLFNIQKDPSRPNNFSNLNRWGKLFLFLTIFFACLNYWEDSKKSLEQEEKIRKRDKKIENLNNLMNCNNLLHIKVRGVLDFGKSTKNGVVQDGFRNLFNDFASIGITIIQNGEKYNGSIDESTSDINFIRYRNIELELDSSELKVFEKMGYKNPYYFEVACPVQFIDTSKNICYVIANAPSVDSIDVKLSARKYSSKRLYKYSGLYIKEIVFKNYKNLTDSVAQSIRPIYNNK